VKFLPQAGKEILLKAVVQAIPTYRISVFLLLITLCKDMNRMMQKLWWGHMANDSKIQLMSWEKMKLSKAKGGGGLRFRDLTLFNKALLAKQGWQLMKNLDSLIAWILKAKYYPNSSFLDSSLGSRPSFAWRNIYGEWGTSIVLKYGGIGGFQSLLLLWFNPP
jgi:hypothetical protein